MSSHNELPYSPIRWAALLIPFVGGFEVFVNSGLQDAVSDLSLLLCAAMIGFRYAIAVCFEAYDSLDAVAKHAGTRHARVAIWATILVILILAASTIPILDSFGQKIWLFAMTLLAALPGVYWYYRDNSDIVKKFTDNDQSGNGAAVLAATDLACLAAVGWAWRTTLTGTPDFQPLAWVLGASILVDLFVGRSHQWYCMIRDVLAFFRGDLAIAPVSLANPAGRLPAAPGILPGAPVSPTKAPGSFLGAPWSLPGAPVSPTEAPVSLPVAPVGQPIRPVSQPQIPVPQPPEAKAQPTFPKAQPPPP